MEVFK